MSGAPTDRPFRIYIPEETKDKAKKFLKKQAKIIFDEIVVPVIKIEAKNRRKPGKRKNFSKAVKKDTRIKQGFRCNSCKKPTDVWDYHHKNGDRSDNSPGNCEALCILCHARITRKKRKIK